MKPYLINGTSIGQYTFSVSFHLMLLFWIQGVEGEYKGVRSPLPENFHPPPHTMKNPWILASGHLEHLALSDPEPFSSPWDFCHLDFHCH